MNVNILRSTITILFVLLWKEFQWSESRIVHQCPLTNITWIKRSKEAGCEEKRSSFYHCYRNREGKLEEKCSGFFIANASGGCSYLLPKGKIAYTNCSGDGCPEDSDPPYPTNEMYKYPGCLKQKRVLSKSPLTPPASESDKMNSNETSERTANVQNDPSIVSESGNNTSKVTTLVQKLVLSTVGVIFLNAMVILVVCVYVRKRTERIRLRKAELNKKDRRSHVYHSIYDTEVQQTNNSVEAEDIV